MIKSLLMPFGLLYGAGMRARGEFYRRGIFKSYDLPGFAVSIGNITVGGTGKTPLVALVAQILAAKGETVCVLTRGYGRANPKERILVSDGETIFADARSAGDEPFELALKLKGNSAIVADADRASAAKWANENLKSTAFVLDDGFQHRRARRDLDIVCIDATKPFGNKKTLPAGILREPLNGLKRAHAFVVTRANLVGESEIAEIKRLIRKYNESAAVFVCENRLARLTDLNDFSRTGQSEGKPKTEKNEKQSPSANYQLPFVAFCALGNAENFFAQLRRENFDLAGAKAFRDHHQYSQKDIANLEKEAELRGAKAFLTTAKDAVKLSNLKFDTPCFVVENELFLDDREAFEKMIAARLYESKELSRNVSETIS